MVTVPRLTGQQVQQQGNPSARLTAEPTPDTYGAAIGAGIRSITDAVENERQRAGEVAVMNAVTSAKRKANQLQYGDTETTGLQYMKGETLFSQADKATQQYSDYLHELRNGLTDENQRLAFDRHAERESLNFDEFTQQRVGAERLDFEDQGLKDFLGEYQQSAAQDAANGAIRMQPGKDGKPVLMEDAYARNLETQELAVRAYASRNRDRLGMDEATFTKHALLQLHSDNASMALEALLTNGDDQTAAAFFDVHKNDMLADARDRAQRAVSSASLVGEAERQSAALFQQNYSEMAADPAGAGPFRPEIGRTFAEQQAQAVKAARESVPEGKLQDEVVDRVKARFQEAETLREGAQQEKFAGLQSLIAQGASDDDVLKHPWATQLDSKQFDSLRKTLKLRGEGQIAQTEDATFYSLKEMAADPERRAEFVSHDLNLDLPNLSTADWNFLKSVQDQAKKGGGDALDGLMSDEAIVNGGIRDLYGDIDTKAKKEKALAFKRQVDDIMLAAGRGKKDLTYVEKRELVDSLTAKVVTDVGFLWDTEERAIDVQPADLDWEDVPVVDQDAMAARLAAQGLDSTDEEALKQEYVSWLRTRGIRRAGD